MFSVLRFRGHVGSLSVNVFLYDGEAGDMAEADKLMVGVSRFERVFRTMVGNRVA